MTIHRAARSIRWFALPLLALPLYSIGVSLEACSSGGAQSDVGETASGLSCAAGETAKRLSVGDVCCRPAANGEESCRVPGENTAGEPCASLGATAPGTSYRATFDVCVEESCSGDRHCTEFPLRVEKRAGTLRCVRSSEGEDVWAWEGAASTHEVERACLVARTEVCRGPGYGSSNPSVYGYSSAYWGGYSQQCGYGTYGAYSGPPSIQVRRLYLMSSTCSAGGAAAADCPVGDL